MTTVSPGVTLVAVLLFALRIPPALGAEQSWIETKSPHFILVSNSNERAARAIVWQFEQIRAVIQNVWPWARVDTSKPILVLAARDEPTMKTLAPQYWEQKGGVRPSSVFVRGADRYYVALRADAKAEDREGINPYINAYWSYVALVLSSSMDRDLPLWFHRGLAGVMSNTLVRDTHIQLGRVIPWHLGRLRDSSRILPRELVTVDRSSPWYTQGERLELFDAECWALVHYLMFGDKGARRQQVNRFAGLLHEGEAPKAALDKAFGEIDPLEKGFSGYVTRDLFVYERLDLDLRVKPEGFQLRALSPAESAAVRAALHAAMNRPAEARALVDEARKADPRLAANDDIDALLLDAERKTEEARRAYARAAELESTSFYTHYRLAVLTWRPDSDAEALSRLEKSLERAIVLNPGFAPAYAFLAQVKGQLGRGDEALSLARRAVVLEPSEVDHKLSLARVLWRISKRDEAQAEARSALASSRTEGERRDAQELIDFFTKSAAPSPARESRASSSPASAEPAAKSVDHNKLATDCDAGDTAACSTLLPIAESACAGGNAGACRAAGWLYASGRGVALDLGRAAGLYQKACEGGARQACINLASMQAQGRGVAKDEAKAFATLERLCNEGMLEGCAQWAVLLAARRPPDMAQARELLKKSCDGGLAEACELLKSMPK